MSSIAPVCVRQSHPIHRIASRCVSKALVRGSVNEGALTRMMGQRSRADT